jgi:nifR3 family TIM-barrel protein
MMNIGHVCLENPTISAPLAGITNLPFRLIAKRGGAGLVCSEMISANGLIYQSKKTYQLLDSHPDEKPLSVQIFGSDPIIMAEAAKMVQDSGADILDINFGCSVRKVLKTGSGSALMKVPEKARMILSAVRQAITIPLTIKMRSGWELSGKDAVLLAKIAQDCGADAIAVHPRTATQGFSGSANWALIAEIKQSVSIPVIGNGDIIAPQDALRMMAQTGCDAVMVGRAAIGKPRIFSQIAALLDGKDPIPEDMSRNFDIMRQYLSASVQYFGEEKACFMMRSRLGWFVKGLKYNSQFRESLKTLASYQEALDKISAYQAVLQQ